MTNGGAAVSLSARPSLSVPKHFAHNSGLNLRLFKKDPGVNASFRFANRRSGLSLALGDDIIRAALRIISGFSGSSPRSLQCESAPCVQRSRFLPLLPLPPSNAPVDSKDRTRASAGGFGPRHNSASL